MGTKPKKIALSEDAYFKLIELKGITRQPTWSKLVDELYELASEAKKYKKKGYPPLY